MRKEAEAIKKVSMDGFKGLIKMMKDIKKDREAATAAEAQRVEDERLRIQAEK